MKGTSVYSRGIAVTGKKMTEVWNRLNLTSRKLFVSAFCGIISHGTVLGVLRPFGISFYAALSEGTAVKVLMAVFIFLWNVVRGDLYESLRQIAIILLYEWIGKIFFRDEKNPGYFRNSLLISAATVITGIFLFIITGQILESLIITVIETVIVYILTVVFSATVHDGELTQQGRDMRKHTGYLGILVLGSAFILGISGIGVAWFRIDRIIAGLGLLMLTRHLGPGFGACAGCMAGLALSDSNDSFISLAGAYSIAGMATGMFRGSKFTAGSTFILLQFIFLILYPDLPLYFAEAVIPAVLFMIVPDLRVGKVLSIKSRIDEPEGESEITGRIRRYAAEKICSMSKAFYRLAHTMERQLQDYSFDGDDFCGSIIDQLTQKICSSCNKASVCWEMKLYYTYRVMCDLIDSIQSEGTGTVGEAEKELAFFCVKSGPVIDALSRMIEIKRVDRLWQKILYESRSIIPEQIYCVSEILTGISAEVVNKIKFFSEEEKNIEVLLRKSDFPVMKAEVKRDENGRFHAEIWFDRCKGHKLCRKLIEDTVTKVLGVNMVMDEGDCKNCGRELCIVSLREKEALGVITGISRLKKSNANVSGDSFSFLKTDNGKYVVALSDGMGSGREANKLSETAIGLFEQLLNCGVSIRLSLNLVNMLISARNSEKYATMDVASIDLYTGETEFFKMGAVPSLVVSGNSMDYIRIDNLPAGFHREGSVQCERRKITDGEFIIMMTDGVYEKLSEGFGEKFLDRVISTKNMLNPQEMADSLLKKACGDDENIDDDMTVLVAKVWRKTG